MRAPKKPLRGVTRNTYEIPVGLHRAVRLAAAEQGITLTQAVVRGLELYVQSTATWRAFLRRAEADQRARSKGRIPKADE